MASSIFKNRFPDTGTYISEKTFYLVISSTLFFGFVVNALEVTLMRDIFLAWNPVAFYITYIVMLIAGVLINVFSRKPLLSFIGYCMVVLPVGALLSIVLPEFAPTTVSSAFIATSLVTAVMILLAIVRPQIFYKAWMIISVCLFVSLLWSLIALFTPFRSAFVWLDWLIVALFCCYIGLDVSWAKNRPKTLDNAVDSACALYLDIINVFIRLLQIFSRND